jgi:hypothetical protein
MCGTEWDGNDDVRLFPPGCCRWQVAGEEEKDGGAGGGWIDGFLQLAPAINGSVTTFVNTRGLVCSFDCRNSTPLFLTGRRPKPAATSQIYPRSRPDLPLLSPVECQSWDQLPLLLPCGSASGAVTQTVLKKTRGLAFRVEGGGTRLLRVPPALRSPRRRRDADGHGYLLPLETCQRWRYATMS